LSIADSSPEHPGPFVRRATATCRRRQRRLGAGVAVDAGRGGHAQIDRELDLPVSWISDPSRCRAAGIPDDVAFATKPALARQMINGFTE
jgi:hypothetical protein